MDAGSSDRSGVTSLADCVTETMTPQEAAFAVEGCWCHAEAVLSPVVGSVGMGVLFRRGVQAAIGAVAPRDRADIERTLAGFSAWIRSMSHARAHAACRVFLGSVERYLLSLCGEERMVHWLGARQGAA